MSAVARFWDQEQSDAILSAFLETSDDASFARRSNGVMIGRSRGTTRLYGYSDRRSWILAGSPGAPSPGRQRSGSFDAVQLMSVRM